MSFKIKIFKISCTFSWWHQDNVLNAGQSAPLGQATSHERILPRLQLFRRQLLPFWRTEAVTSMNCSQLLSSCHTRRMPKLRMFGWPHPAAPTDSNCTQLLLSGAACGCHQLLPRLEHHWCQHSNCEMSSKLSPSVCLLIFIIHFQATAGDLHRFFQPNYLPPVFFSSLLIDCWIFLGDLFTWLLSPCCTWYPGRPWRIPTATTHSTQPASCVCGDKYYSPFTTFFTQWRF